MKLKNNIPRFSPRLNNYKELNDSCEELSEIKKTSRDSNDSSDIIPVNAYDIFNYVAKYNVANFQIQTVMKLDGKLNFDKLVRAVRLSIEAEPVLGCGFIKKSTPYWKRFENIDDVEFCSMVTTENADEAVRSFLESPLCMDNSPLLKIRLIRSNMNDTLVVKINHVCSDAGGVREYIHLLAGIYSRIDAGDNSFVPAKNVRGNEDHQKLLSALCKEGSESTWSLEEQTPMSSWKFPWKNSRMGETRFSVCRLPDGYLDILKSYAKKRGATINDLILTAIFRAMFKISNPPYGVPMDIPITIDLRKYLPEHKAQAIRNFSGGTVVRIRRKPRESFAGTLKRVTSVTKGIKDKHPSLKNARMAKYFEKVNFHYICSSFKAMSRGIEFTSELPFLINDKCSPVLSNFGMISDSILKFGKNIVTDAYVIPPVVRAPGMLLVASTYNGVVTLAVGYYKPSVRKSDMDGLLEKIKDELVKGCSK